MKCCGRNVPVRDFVDEIKSVEPRCCEQVQRSLDLRERCRDPLASQGELHNRRNSCPCVAVVDFRDGPKHATQQVTQPSVPFPGLLKRPQIDLATCRSASGISEQSLELTRGQRHLTLSADKLCEPRRIEHSNALVSCVVEQLARRSRSDDQRVIGTVLTSVLLDGHQVNLIRREATIADGLDFDNGSEAARGRIRMAARPRDASAFDQHISLPGTRELFRFKPQEDKRVADSGLEFLVLGTITRQVHESLSDLIRRR